MYGHNPTSVKVAKAAQTNTSKTYFGSMFVMDCPLTTLPNISSNIIGYAQGMTASASQTELGLLMILHFVFTEREYNGSTISILGRNLVFENVREMPVVGGSGLFRFARGYAEGKTYSLDVKSGNATLEYNSKGNPQWGGGCMVCRWGNNHRFFGPTTTTRNVYDVNAHQVVNGAMEGINGTIFAYGVTSSGKTHTMHGDQRSPGIIPLAVKDAFSIIQEVVNDLLNPAGHNLRIREDKQNLVDLAGSESSKVETSGLRRKEGSYINKSLLTLETLRDVKASHVPYRDSKLTRILHSSLSGHGRVSLICTVTPASRSSEETHNTLKFAHRAKHIEIQPEQNKALLAYLLPAFIFLITDEKSLIKKYQHEIRRLREELEQLKQDIVPVPPLKDMGAHDTILLNQKLAYLPYKRKDLMDDEDIDIYVPVEGSAEIRDVPCREEKKTRKHGLLKKRDNSSSASEQSSVEQLSESREDREAPEDMETLETSNIDELDLMREHKKILLEEAALQSSSLKRLSDEVAKSPQNEETKEEINALHDDIKAKNDQIATLEKQILDYVMTSHEALDKSDILQAVAELRDQLNEESFELEVETADSRIIHEQLNQKTSDCQVLQEEVANLKQHLSNSLELAQETKIEELKLKTKELNESKEQLEHRNRKLAEESSYAKSLASAAAVELKALSEEVAKLMNHNRKLSAELSTHSTQSPNLIIKQEQRKKIEPSKETRTRQLVNDGAEERTKNEQRP
uniref:Kinesin motor domain-containing protein n=1 Tax=Brassica campestris TaxID=3711 RepID=M4FC78_BRACM